MGLSVRMTKLQAPAAIAARRNCSLVLILISHSCPVRLSALTSKVAMVDWADSGLLGKMCKVGVTRTVDRTADSIYPYLSVLHATVA